MRQRPNHCFNLSTSSAPVQRAVPFVSLHSLRPVAHQHGYARPFRNSSLSNLESRVRCKLSVAGDIFQFRDALFNSEPPRSRYSLLSPLTQGWKRDSDSISEKIDSSPQKSMSFNRFFPIQFRQLFQERVGFFIHRYAIYRLRKSNWNFYREELRERISKK